MHVSSNKDEISSEIYIATQPERVFQVLTDPKQVMVWSTHPDYPRQGVFDGAGMRWMLDLSTATNQDQCHGDTKFHCEGEVLGYDPPRVLVHTWIANWHGDSRGASCPRGLHERLGRSPYLEEIYRNRQPLANLAFERESASKGNRF